jgi:hypothetical protein
MVIILFPRHSTLLRSPYLRPYVRNTVTSTFIQIQDAVKTNMPPKFLPTLKVKVQFTLEQATKAKRGSISIALLFLQPWQ